MSRLFNKHYDTWMGPLELWAFQSIRKRLLQQAKGTVLEIGSGTGVNFNYYQHADRVIAVEPELSMLEKSLVRAKQSVSPIEVVAGSAEKLPFDSDFFDTVVGTLVFCTIPDPLVAMTEIRRVCKPGGKVLLFEHVRLNHPIWGTLQDWLTPTWKRLCSGCHLNRNTLKSVKQAGFQITHIEWKYKRLFLVVEAVNEK